MPLTMCRSIALSILMLLSFSESALSLRLTSKNEELKLTSFENSGEVFLDQFKGALTAYHAEAQELGYATPTGPIFDDLVVLFDEHKVVLNCDESYVEAYGAPANGIVQEFEDLYKHGETYKLFELLIKTPRPEIKSILDRKGKIDQVFLSSPLSSSESRQLPLRFPAESKAMTLELDPRAPLSLKFETDYEFQKQLFEQDRKKFDGLMHGLQVMKEIPDRLKETAFVQPDYSVKKLAAMNIGHEAAGNELQRFFLGEFAPNLASLIDEGKSDDADQAVYTALLPLLAKLRLLPGDKRPLLRILKLTEFEHDADTVHKDKVGGGRVLLTLRGPATVYVQPGLRVYRCDPDGGTIAEADLQALWAEGKSIFQHEKFGVTAYQTSEVNDGRTNELLGEPTMLALHAAPNRAVQGDGRIQLVIDFLGISKAGGYFI